MTIDARLHRLVDGPFDGDWYAVEPHILTLVRVVAPPPVAVLTDGNMPVVMARHVLYHRASRRNASDVFEWDETT